jgi:hypothetical protein
MEFVVADRAVTFVGSLLRYGIVVVVAAAR